MRELRILQVVTLSELGGAQSIVGELANRLAQDGHTVRVAAGGDGRLWGMLDPRIGQERLARMQREVAPLTDLAALLELRAVFERFDPQVVHLHSSKAGVLGRFAVPRDRVVYTIHGFDTILKANPAYLGLERLLRRRARTIVAVSEYDRRNLALNGIPGAELVRNGVSDCGAETADRDSEAALRLQALKQRGDFVVMCIARLAPPKRFDLFCAAAALAGGSSTWVWVGNRDPQQHLPRNVICLGEHPRASQLIPYADVFVLPSDYEGLPVSILEACARARPVIASAVGGIGEIVTAAMGFCVENRAEEFADRVEVLRRDTVLRAALGAGARRVYESMFTLDMMVRRYEALYDRAGSRD